MGSRNFHFHYTANVAASWSISECHLQSLKLLLPGKVLFGGKKCSYHFQNTEGFVVSKRDSQNKDSLKALAFMQGTKAGSWLSREASASLLHTPRMPETFTTGFRRVFSKVKCSRPEPTSKQGCYYQLFPSVPLHKSAQASLRHMASTTLFPVARGFLIWQMQT